MVQPVAGFVWDLKLPRGPDGRVKGFAFAAFTCQAHAQKAIQQCNGKVGEGYARAVASVPFQARTASWMRLRFRVGIVVLCT